MAQYSTTANYSYRMPDVNDKVSTNQNWGNDLNYNWDKLDSDLTTITPETSKVFARSSSNINISPSVFTRVTNYNVEDIDVLNEFASSRFTADDNGRYLFSGNVATFFSAATGFYILALYKDGAVLDYMKKSGPISIATILNLDYSFVVDVSATSYIDLYMYQTSGVTATTYYQRSNLSVTRLKD